MASTSSCCLAETDISVSSSFVSSRKPTLQGLNDEAVHRRIAPIVYLGILIFIGLPGNLTVLIVYYRKYSQSSHRVFILALAVFDSIACAVCMPFEIIEMQFQYTFYAVNACKVFRFNNTFNALVGCFILTILAINRHRLVCQPLKTKMTIRTAWICVGICAFLSLLFSWPTLLFSGTEHVDLGYNITGYDCSISDSYKKSKVLAYIFGFWFLLFMMCIVTLIVLYGLIGRTVYRRMKGKRHLSIEHQLGSSKAKGAQNFNVSNETLSTSVSDSDGQEKVSSPEKGQTTSRISIPLQDLTSKNSRSVTDNQKRSTQPAKPEHVANRITKIAFVISLFFIISYLPHLVLNVITAVKGNFVAEPEPIVSAVLPIVSRSVFINNVVNPFIYGFYDPKFGRTVKKTLFLTCKRI